MLINLYDNENNKYIEIDKGEDEYEDEGECKYNKLYINQYIFEKINNINNNSLKINDINKFENNDNNLNNNNLNNNNLNNNNLNNNIYNNKIIVILFIDKNYNEKQIYNVLNQAYLNFNVFLFFIEDIPNNNFEKKFNKKKFNIIKDKSINNLFNFLNIIVKKDNYLLFLYNNIYINNYNLLENINKKKFSTNETKHILFKYNNIRYHKIFVSNKNMVEFIYNKYVSNNIEASLQ